MKVLIVSHKIFSIDMQWGFLQNGCDVRILYPATADQLGGVLKDYRPDLLVTAGPPLELDKVMLRSIGERDASSYKYAHWDTDGISSTLFPSDTGLGIEMDVIELSKPDVVFTMCPEMLNMVKTHGCHAEMLPYAFSPLSHYPMQSGEEGYKHLLNIVGQSYLQIALKNLDHYRYKSIGILLKPLIEHGYSINFYGDNGYRTLLKALWELDVPAEWFNGYLPYEKTCEAYNTSFINLVTQNHEHTITKRTFEILGCGGFVLSSDNTALREFFTPGRDLEVSSSPEQTVELVEYYKNHPQAYRAVRKNALEAAGKHTYKQRAETILQTVME